MRRRLWTIVMTASLGIASQGLAQVAPEPSLVTARLHGSNLVQGYFAIPQDQFVLGMMLRFALFDDFDLGGRAGAGFVDGADDYVFVGGDGRYALIFEEFGRGGPSFNLTFHTGIGASASERITRWKLPIGFPTGLTFPLGGRSALEFFTHPRLELGFQNVSGDRSDAALLLDLGGYWQGRSALGFIVDFRFGDGLFGEGNQSVFGLAISARF